MGLVLHFGKYKGKSIQDVYTIDMDYARWLLNHIDLSKNPEMKEWLEDKFKLDDSSSIRFGKHKNKTLKWVAENDPKYLDWIVNSTWTEKNAKSIVEEAKKLLDTTT